MLQIDVSSRDHGPVLIDTVLRPSGETSRPLSFQIDYCRKRIGDPSCDETFDRLLRHVSTCPAFLDPSSMENYYEHSVVSAVRSAYPFSPTSPKKLFLTPPTLDALYVKYSHHRQHRTCLGKYFQNLIKSAFLAWKLHITCEFERKHVFRRSWPISCWMRAANSAFYRIASWRDAIWYEWQFNWMSKQTKTYVLHDRNEMYKGYCQKMSDDHDKNDTREFFASYRRVLPKQIQMPVAIVNNEGLYARDPQGIVDIMQDHFMCQQKGVKLTPCEALARFQFSSTLKNNDDFREAPFPKLVALVDKAKNFKAPGSNTIVSELMKVDPFRAAWMIKSQENHEAILHCLSMVWWKISSAA